MENVEADHELVRLALLWYALAGVQEMAMAFRVNADQYTLWIQLAFLVRETAGTGLDRGCRTCVHILP